MPVRFLKNLSSIFRFALVGALSLPIVAILWQLFFPLPDLWLHFWTNKLPFYMLNSIVLCAIVGIGTVLLGTSAGFLMANYDFLGRAKLEKALLLPFAMPSYLLGYVFVNLFQFGGPIHTHIQEIAASSGFMNIPWPSVRNVYGASLVMVLALFPYIYMFSYVSFRSQSVSYLQASRTLGLSQISAIFKVTFPIARPQILAGLALVLMEVMADFGTVEHFAVETMTLGVYRAWFGMGSPIFASQLSVLLLIIVAVLIWTEKVSRKKATFVALDGAKIKVRQKLTARYAILCSIALWAPVLFGFILPFCYLIFLCFEAGQFSKLVSFLPLLLSNVALAFFATLLCVSFGAFLASGFYKYRFRPIFRMVMGLPSFGYAVPGAVLSVGILLSFGALESFRTTLAVHFPFLDSVPLFSGTIAAVTLAYCVRFTSVPFHSLSSTFAQIPPNLADAGALLGASRWKVFSVIHWPLLRASAGASALLVFVDVVKELPATMILRPFDFETLAVRTFLLASDERLSEAAPAAVLLILIGTLPVMLISAGVIKSNGSSKIES